MCVVAATVGLRHLMGGYGDFYRYIKMIGVEYLLTMTKKVPECFFFFGSAQIHFYPYFLLQYPER